MIRALTVAGFDGSAGAGILQDVKTMAHFGVYAEAVCTAMTEQSEDEFVTPGWLIWDRIEAQLETLFKAHTFQFVKIGLVEKAKILKRIVHFIREKSPEAFILWDPIATASTGYHFLRNAEHDDFLPIMKELDLITPNQDEFGVLGIGLAASREQIELGTDIQVLLKGGHTQEEEAADVLWYKGAQFKFSSPRLEGTKHGTGCALSSAILANVALGKSVPEACRTAKEYMDSFLKSGEGLLGGLFNK